MKLWYVKCIYASFPIHISDSLGGDDSRDAGEIVGYANICPRGYVEQRLHRGERVVAEFENQDAARFEVVRGLGDQVAVEFVSFFAAE
jgi:hypothetical protein